jgi:hypothetical protein
MRVIIDLLDKTRFYCSELLEIFKVAERNYTNTVNKLISFIVTNFRNKERRILIRLEMIFLDHFCQKLKTNLYRDVDKKGKDNL